MAEIFISYARVDYTIASRLGYLCDWEGWTSWIDREIELGQDFRPIINKEMDVAKCVVVIWSESSVNSQWVKYETNRAIEHGKLVEIELKLGLSQKVALDNDEQRLPATLMGERIQVDPNKETLLAQIAKVGKLPRPCDNWNATLTVNNWKNKSPRHPIICWEWNDVKGQNPRIVRREFWKGTPKVEFQTTIGNIWQFGYEDTLYSLGYLQIKQPQHFITLPKRDKQLERQAKAASFGIAPFTHGGTVIELLSDTGYPDLGAKLN